VSLSPSQIRTVAPNVAQHLYLWRPTRADPPLASIHQLRTIYNIDDLADFHEMMDLEEHLQAKAMEDVGRRQR
jgi:hypothetical protein